MFEGQKVFANFAINLETLETWKEICFNKNNNWFVMKQQNNQNYNKTREKPKNEIRIFFETPSQFTNAFNNLIR